MQLYWLANFFDTFEEQVSTILDVGLNSFLALYLVCHRDIIWLETSTCSQRRDTHPVCLLGIKKEGALTQSVDKHDVYLIYR